MAASPGATQHQHRRIVRPDARGNAPDAQVRGGNNGARLATAGRNRRLAAMR
jgi:hypothetical protein